jgi:hypothetical protein
MEGVYIKRLRSQQTNSINAVNKRFQGFMDEIAPMLVAISLIVTTGGVILLRPITRKLGSYLEVLAEERRRALNQQPAVPAADTARLAAALERIEDRLANVEKNQDFTEKLLAEREPSQLHKG